MFFVFYDEASRKVSALLHRLVDFSFIIIQSRIFSLKQVYEEAENQTTQMLLQRRLIKTLAGMVIKILFRKPGY